MFMGLGFSHALSSLWSWSRNQEKCYLEEGGILFCIFGYYYFVFVDAASIRCLKSKSKRFTKKVYVRSQLPHSFSLGRFLVSRGPGL